MARRKNNYDNCFAFYFVEGLTTKNLGRYENKPIFDSKINSTVIKYTNGDTCPGTRKITSTITFICKPGKLSFFKEEFHLYVSYRTFSIIFSN